MKNITLYVRRNCSHCRQALDRVQSVRAVHPFAFRIVDVDRDLERSDPRRSRLAIDVPVLEIDGREAFRHEVDAERLTRMVLGLDAQR
ncbi:MAG: glutaredoxin family protein [Polyangiaceae bacterium]|jgi:glutaredoxin|nr:glutaredoxin family protein [Polyangiaceae bacterium]